MRQPVGKPGQVRGLGRRLDTLAYLGQEAAVATWHGVGRNRSAALALRCAAGARAFLSV